ncbi:MAG: septum formation protein Maf [Candidatus Omnitrophica bacterium]|nr:septum formation protein Maf [Candidatus Omnitrophota bacterium]
MKPLILASASAQRQNLMKILNLPFIVKKSKAREILEIKTNVADLVKENAFIKALDVAEELKEGLVIGADTVVYANGRLVLKPGSLKEAKKNLKMLMSAPHWVYTGVAVIDARTKKALVDYDKTKVYMSKLTDGEIDRYHREVPPMDKAGGFDIEGRGGLFIPRIDGCYFNVVGLPLAKLCQMLKKFGVHALALGFVFTASFAVSGCSGLSSNFNTATNQEETTMYSTDSELQIGASAAQEMEKEYKVVDDVELNKRVDEIAQKIAAVCDRKELVYVAKVIDEKKPGREKIVNALSLPGGYVYVFRDLMDYIKDDDQLAAVIAHEIGHVTARHSIKHLQASYGSMLAVLAAIPVNGNLAGGLNVAFQTMMFKYSREDELEADRLGLKYMTAAGFKPQGMVKMLESLEAYDRKQPIRPKTYERTHPYSHERIAAVNQQIKGDLTFQDYVRTTGETDGKK